VNDSESDGGSFSELSDSDMCKVSSPFGGSSTEEEEVVQPEPVRGTKRKCRTLPKRTNTDFELLVTDAPTGLTIKNRTFCPNCIYVFFLFISEQTTTVPHIT
jgi:hypothetical protein